MKTSLFKNVRVKRPFLDCNRYGQVNGATKTGINFMKLKGDDNHSPGSF